MNNFNFSIITKTDQTVTFKCVHCATTITVHQAQGKVDFVSAMKVAENHNIYNPDHCTHGVCRMNHGLDANGDRCVLFADENPATIDWHRQHAADIEEWEAIWQQWAKEKRLPQTKPSSMSLKMQFNQDVWKEDAPMEFLLLNISDTVVNVKCDHCGTIITINQAYGAFDFATTLKVATHRHNIRDSNVCTHNICHRTGGQMPYGGVCSVVPPQVIDKEGVE